MLEFAHSRASVGRWFMPGHKKKSFYMLRALIAFIAVFGFCHAAFAEKIYKIVDANGKVSFTNQDSELISASAQGKAEEIEVKADYSNKTRITSVGSVSFCGSIALPSRDVSSDNYYGNVVSKRDGWVSEINRLNADMSRLTRGRVTRYSGPGSYTMENLEKHSEYTCAKEWADEQRLRAKEEKDLLFRKNAGLITYLNELKDGFISVCGEEPVFSQEDRLYEDRRKAWRTCSSTYKSKMQDIENDLKKTDRQLLDIKKIEDIQK